MTRLWELWIAYCDRIPYPPSERRFARDIGMSPTAFGNWQHGISRLPDRHNLARFARQINMPYDKILDAALRDSGYLPEPAQEGGEGNAGSAPSTSPADDRPPLLAVASGDTGDEALAREATERARQARQEQLDAIEEMKRRQREKGDRE